MIGGLKKTLAGQASFEFICFSRADCKAAPDNIIVTLGISVKPHKRVAKIVLRSWVRHELVHECRNSASLGR
jgi:hypothetical protein